VTSQDATPKSDSSCAPKIAIATNSSPALRAMITSSSSARRPGQATLQLCREQRTLRVRLFTGFSRGVHEARLKHARLPVYRRLVESPKDLVPLSQLQLPRWAREYVRPRACHVDPSGNCFRLLYRTNALEEALARPRSVDHSRRPPPTRSTPARSCGRQASRARRSRALPLCSNTRIVWMEAGTRCSACPSRLSPADRHSDFAPVGTRIRSMLPWVARAQERVERV